MLSVPRPAPPERVTVVCTLPVVLISISAGANNVNVAPEVGGTTPLQLIVSAPAGETVRPPLKLQVLPVAPTSVTVCCAEAALAKPSARKAPAMAIVRRRRFCRDGIICAPCSAGPKFRLFLGIPQCVHVRCEL